jgi:hypothetical protein
LQDRIVCAYPSTFCCGVSAYKTQLQKALKTACRQIFAASILSMHAAIAVPFPARNPLSLRPIQGAEELIPQAKRLLDREIYNVIG